METVIIVKHSETGSGSCLPTKNADLAPIVVQSVCLVAAPHFGVRSRASATFAPPNRQDRNFRGIMLLVKTSVTPEETQIFLPAKRLFLFISTINYFHKSDSRKNKTKYILLIKSIVHLSPDIDLKASQAFTLEKDAGSIDWLLRCAESPSGQSRKKI